MKVIIALCALALTVFLGQASVRDRSSVAPRTATSFNVEAATQAYLAQIPPDKRLASDRYFEGGYWLYFGNIVYTASLMLVFLLSGLSVKLRDRISRLTSRRNLQVAAYFAPLLLITAALRFPLAFYEDFIREHQYGLSNQTSGSWLREYIVGWIVLILATTVLVVALLAIVRRVGRSWWIWAATATVFFIALGLLLLPVFIEPLFNQHSELESGPVREALLSMARANGISASHVYVADASRQSTRISANVSGLFGTTRITLNDNLLQRCSFTQIKAVMAHEMGHYVLNHNFEELLFLATLALLLFGVLDWSLRAALRQWGQRWRVTELSDPALIPLAIVIVCLFFAATTPIRNSFEREQEYEADIFGLNAARQPDGFAQVALKFAEYRKLQPSKWEEIVFYDHPSGRARIRSAMRWKAEHLDESPGSP